MSRRTTEPRNVNALFTVRTEYYRKELQKIVKAIFEIKCPDDWDEDYILNTLIYDGYFIIANGGGIGTNAFKCGLRGVNYMQNPVTALVTLPYIKQFERTIGEDCTLFFLEREPNQTYYNFGQKINIFAQRLANADGSIDVNLLNSRLGYVVEAETKAQAETIKLIYDKITSGEPMVVYRKDAVLGSSGLNAFFGNVKQMYIANDVLDTKRTIMNEFLTSIGINNANTDKKERLITNEVNANNVEMMANTLVWKRNLEKANAKCRKMFSDIDFSIKLSSTVEPKEGTVNDTNRFDKSMGDKK